jgi:hypothetical protein
MIPGKKPASAAPSRKRTTRKLASFQINAMPADNSPQVTMIRAIHSRAPNRSSAKLLGTSKMKKPKKKIPGTPTEHRRGESEIIVHLQCGEADIDAIQVAEKVAERDKRHDPPADLADDRRFHVRLLPGAEAARRLEACPRGDPACGLD